MNYIELSAAVAEKLGFDVNVEDERVYAYKKYDGKNVISIMGLFEPASDLTLALQLSAQHKINIDHDTGVVYIGSDNSFEFDDLIELPYAICMVYLQGKL